MKYADCNERQKKAFRNIYYAANFLIGGLENTISDYAGYPEAAMAEKELADHEGLVKTVYNMAINEVHTEGSMQFGPAAESYLKDVRFCGKEWLMERVEARLRKLGY